MGSSANVSLRNNRDNLIRSAFYSLLFLAVCGVFPFGLAQRITTKGDRPADVITVTNTNDSGAGSLRQALADAHDGDTINFAVTGTISLTSGELLITKTVTISGPGANVLAVMREPSAASFRIFHLTPNHTVTIEGLTVGNGSIPSGFGGGILNQESTLIINGCAVSGNSALSPQGLGGGIFSNGSGAGGFASLTITDSVLSGNVAANGGAIFNDGASGIGHFDHQQQHVKQ